MKFPTYNLSRIILYIAIPIILFSCGTSEEKAPISESQEVESEVDIANPPPSSVNNTKAEAIKNAAALTGSLQFEPSLEDQKKYTLLKEILQKNKDAFRSMVQARRLSKYKSTNRLNPQEVIRTAEGITSQDLKTFLTRSSMDKANYDLKMNEIASALGFSLIENFGSSKDQGKYFDMSLQVKQLISSGAITNVDELRSKMFQAELNSKMTPAKGNENLKIEVGDDGKVYIKQ